MKAALPSTSRMMRYSPSLRASKPTETMPSRPRPRGPLIPHHGRKPTPQVSRFGIVRGRHSGVYAELGIDPNRPGPARPAASSGAGRLRAAPVAASAAAGDESDPDHRDSRARAPWHRIGAQPRVLFQGSKVARTKGRNGSSREARWGRSSFGNPAWDSTRSTVPW